MSTGKSFPILARIILVALLLAMALLFSGCEFTTNARQLWDQIIGQVVPSEIPAEDIATATHTPQKTITPPFVETTLPPQADLVELVIWVPPQFDPQADLPASHLLADRIREFEQQNKNVFIQVRVKPASGLNGLLESLSITSGAAQAAMPSIVALSRSDLETAVSRKLVYPLDSFSTGIDAEDWYQYARDLAVIGGSSYGLTFAGDALMLLNRPAVISNQPATWEEVLQRGEPMSFPAADPQALLPMSLYMSAGGDLVNTQRLPKLDVEILSEVFQLFADGASAGTFPMWTTQFQKDSDAWTAYNELRTNWVVTWSSKYLLDPAEDTVALPLPAMKESSITIVDGWVWCMTDPRTENSQVNAQLIEFLTDAQFLIKWDPAAGALPVRPSTLSGWNDAKLSTLLEQVALSAQNKPRNEVISTLGPILSDQLVQILSGKTTAPIAAQTVVEKIENP